MCCVLSCVLCVVCWLVFVVRCSLCVVRCALFVVGSLVCAEVLLDVWCSLFDVCCLFVVV